MTIKWLSMGARFAALLFGLGAVTGPVARAQHVHVPKPAVAPVIGSAAIPFELKSLEGTPMTLAMYRDKALILNFFASWCDPCREEMPLINELASKAHGDSYQILGVAVDDSRAAVAEFAKEAKLVFPIALDLNSTVKRSYRIFGPPATFFIDGQGIIRDIVLGPLNAERAKEATRKIAMPR